MENYKCFIKLLLVLSLFLLLVGYSFAVEPYTNNTNVNLELNTSQLNNQNEMNLHQQSIESMMTSEELKVKWDSVFFTLDNLENSLSNSEELVNTLTMNLEELNNQWWMLSERMMENDYYMLKLEKENNTLIKKNNNLLWALIVSGIVCFTTGLVVGICL